MSQEQRARIVLAWLNHLSRAYIAHTEGVTEDEVQAAITRACRVGKFQILPKVGG